MSVTATAGLAAGLAYADQSSASTGTLARSAAAANPTSAATSNTVSGQVQVTGASGTATAAASTTAAAATTTGFTDGSYTGSTVNTKWGPVQVQVTISGGKITDVAALQYPNDRGKSVAINAQALPILQSEALTAQSASINTVSGATYTSDGYTQSLQSALDLAHGTPAG
jgi:uncharacterized protein with FMN-binding domain